MFVDLGYGYNHYEIGFGIPSALKKFAEHGIGRHCYSVCYKPDGELVVGRDFTVRLYNKKHEVVRDVDSKYPTSVVSANGKVYFTNLWDFGRVVIQTEQLDDPNNMLARGNTLYHFTRSYTFNQMDVHENWSALVNNSTADVLLYNMHTSQSYRRELEDTPNYVNFHRDGDLLLTFTSASKLVKYAISDEGTLSIVWTCNLENPCGVCTDEMGLIFVRSGESGSYRYNREKTGVIYVITKEGRVIKPTNAYPVASIEPHACSPHQGCCTFIVHGYITPERRVMRTMFYFSYLLTAFGLSKSKQTSDIPDPTNTCTCTYIRFLGCR